MSTAAPMWRGHWTAVGGPGRRGEDGPGSQETSLRPPSRQALEERGGSMSIHHIRALCAGFLLVFATSASAAAGPINIHVRIEGAKRTLVPERSVTLADAPVVKDGNPDHSCPGQTALGALQQGTQGAWDGSWSEGLGYFVSAIKGEKPGGNDFFDLWVDHREATAGFCDETLNAGDSVLIFRQTCVYDPSTQLCPDEISPLGIQSPISVKRGKHATLTV